MSGPVSGTDKTLSFETGKFALQSQGAVVATIGRTKVLTTANAAKDVRPGMDFFPLTVDVEERAYAAGKIPGSFFRREGRPTEEAILTCRLTDRPLRPSFPEGFRNETQIVTTVMGADQENPHDVLSINAASAALMISGIPFEGPTAFQLRMRRARPVRRIAVLVPKTGRSTTSSPTARMTTQGRRLLGRPEPSSLVNLTRTTTTSPGCGPTG